MTRVAKHRPLIALTNLAAVIMVGCTTGSPVSLAPSTDPTATAEASVTDTPVPSPTPVPGLPGEVVGSWEADLRDFLDEDEICSPCGPEVRFTIREHGSWNISRAGGQASGSFAVDGGQIVFGPSTACQGTGTYEWQADGDSLTLTAAEPDECERRQEALDGITFTRAD